MPRSVRKLLIKMHVDAKQQHEATRGSDNFLAINNKLRYLRIDPLRGLPVPKSQIPEKYKDLDVNNLFKISINDSLNAIYTVGSNEKEIIALVIEFLDTEKFDETFANVDFGDEREAIGTTDVK